MIIYFQNPETWKIQLTTAINFISSKDAEKYRLMNSTSNNIKLTPYSDVNEVIHELFESLCLRYQGNLEKSMRGSDFIFDLVQLMYYKFHRVNVKHVGSYTDSTDCIKKEKGAINPKKTDDKCFQYAVTVALNYEEIK